MASPEGGKVKTSPIVSIISGLLILSALVACQNAQPTVDTSATVNAAVQATHAAQASLNATVEAAVKATSAAMQPTAASTGAAASKSATPKPASATATPIPSATYVTMTEEELAALINQAVQEAVAATTTATTATTTYSADGTLTAQEVQALQTSVATAQSEISQALALAQAYYDLYSQIATESLATLQAIEQDLNSMAASMNSMAASLQQISQTLAQGLTLAQSTITQLQATAQKAATTAQNAQTKAKTFNNAVKTELDKLATTALSTKPTNIPTDLRSTAQSVNTYIETVRSALGDSKVTKIELSSISVAGANAVAGLNAHGGAQFQGLASAINSTTSQIARGETQKAKTSLGGLEQSMKSLNTAISLPAGPSLPSGGLPGKRP
jgi:hypothetical protein